MTQPLIWEQLWELGFDISTGQVNRIITEDKGCFHQEKNGILDVGLEISPCVNVDDTCARHKGKNGYCTHIGSDLFAWFETSHGKSRLNFLRMRANNKDYALNSTAFDYMKTQKLPVAQMELLTNCGRTVFDYTEWRLALESLGFTKDRHIRIATEGALLGSIRKNESINPGGTKSMKYRKLRCSLPPTSHVRIPKVMLWSYIPWIPSS